MRSLLSTKVVTRRGLAGSCGVSGGNAASVSSSATMYENAIRSVSSPRYFSNLVQLNFEQPDRKENITNKNIREMVACGLLVSICIGFLSVIFKFPG